MTILFKEALEKIKKEEQELSEEKPKNIDALFRELDEKIKENKEEEEYNPFAEEEFKSLDPKKK